VLLVHIYQVPVWRPGREGNDMQNTKPAFPVFKEGDEVVLASGSNQGTAGVFVCLKTDTNWADIKERNGKIRSHPMEWLALNKALKL